MYRNYVYDVSRISRRCRLQFARRTHPPFRQLSTRIDLRHRTLSDLEFRYMNTTAKTIVDVVGWSMPFKEVNGSSQ